MFVIIRNHVLNFVNLLFYFFDFHQCGMWNAVQSGWELQVYKYIYTSVYLMLTCFKSTRMYIRCTFYHSAFSNS